VYKTICDILQNKANDQEDEVMYQAASIQLISLERYFSRACTEFAWWVVHCPCQVCANLEVCMEINAHKKVKGLLPLASLNKCLHDLAKEQKVAPMECINCEYYCHEGDADLPFDAE
jgi:hypothetical protein